MKRLVLSTVVCIMMTTMVSARDAKMAQRHLMKDSARVECRKADGDFRCEKREKHEKLTAEQRAQDKTQFLSKKLSLAEQKSKRLYSVFLQEAKSFEKAIADFADKDEQEKKAAIEKIRIKTESKVKSILNAEEFAQYRELCKQRQDKGAKRHGMHQRNHDSQKPDRD